MLVWLCRSPLCNALVSVLLATAMEVEMSRGFVEMEGTRTWLKEACRVRRTEMTGPSALERMLEVLRWEREVAMEGRGGTTAV